MISSGNRYKLHMLLLNGTHDYTHVMAHCTLSSLTTSHMYRSSSGVCQLAISSILLSWYALHVHMYMHMTEHASTKLDVMIFRCSAKLGDRRSLV